MIRFLALVMLLGIALPSQAQWRERRAALSEMHRVEEFRIFYSRSGADALPDVGDANQNGTPDYVERIAHELVRARDFYQNQLLLRHPMSSPRYRNQAEFIDVNLLDFPLKPGGPSRGVAYDGLSTFARVQDAGRMARVLVIDISNDLPARNATAAHEVFHLYQYGYTFFKNRWYLEGTARWAERLGKAGSDKPAAWPQSSAEIHELFGQAYETAPFWRQLVARVDPGERKFIKAFLEELDRTDDTLRADAKWTEAEQKIGANDLHIWGALRSTLSRTEFLAQWKNPDIRNLMAIEP